MAALTDCRVTPGSTSRFLRRRPIVEVLPGEMKALPDPGNLGPFLAASVHERPPRAINRDPRGSEWSASLCGFRCTTGNRVGVRHPRCSRLRNPRLRNLHSSGPRRMLLCSSLTVTLKRQRERRSPLSRSPPLSEFTGAKLSEGAQPGPGSTLSGGPRKCDVDSGRRLGTGDGGDTETEVVGLSQDLLQNTGRNTRAST